MRFSLPGDVERIARRMLSCVAILAVISIGVCAFLWIRSRFDLVIYIDIPLHLFGGFVASLSFLVLIYVVHGVKSIADMPYWLRAVLVMGFTALVTIAWEFFEHITDTYVGTHLHSTVIETLKDMAVGLVGSLPVALWLTRVAVTSREKNEKQKEPNHTEETP
jgi:hypothetical protein